ncbi:MAG: SpoIIIAH-like family protein [Eubacterium sp.]|nr:SpoIIIAH-like family protein [Oscillospiraceae bacterium]MDY4608431.1 SpoIIIAH-like family protein [Eubacterium sp.]
MNEEKNKSGYHFKPKETKDAKPAEKEQIKPAKETATAQKSSAKTKQKKVKKSKKTRAAVAIFVLLLGVGVAGNWYYENTDLSKTIKPLISSSKTLGKAELVDATTTTSAKKTESEYFSSARVDRQSARDSSLEKLQAVVDSANESKDAKAEATSKIAEISSYISTENKIETLVTAKGVDNCLAVISSDGTKVDIIVDTDDLTDNLIMQIKEIAMEQVGCSFEDVSIIQSKSAK